MPVTRNMIVAYDLMHREQLFDLSTLSEVIQVLRSVKWLTQLEVSELLSESEPMTDVMPFHDDTVANLDTALITGESYLSNQQCDRQENEFSHVEIKEWKNRIVKRKLPIPVEETPLFAPR